MANPKVYQGTFALVMLAALALLTTPASGAIEKGDVVIRLEPVAIGLTAPHHLTHAGDGSGRMFIVDQAGKIRILKNGALLATPFLDLTALLPALNPGFDERGLLGLAFHPDYADNGRFFVRYSAPRAGDPAEPCFATSRGCHEEILAEFSVSANPDVADPVGTILFRVNEPQFNHNAGMVQFGSDGFLYFTLGDGGGAHDGLADSPPSHGPIGNGQNIDTPLGAILRIDVDGGGPFAIPADNPFAAGAGNDMIYAYGMRNPFRFSFDDGPGGDGSLVLADVGQNLFEEVNIVDKGGNYGWVIREGTHCFDPFSPNSPPASCPDTGPLGEPLLDPIVDYSHADGGISIIGGYVYRGARSPSLTGSYLFGDFGANFGVPSGRLYFLPGLAGDPIAIEEFRIGLDDRPYGLFLKGFGEDEQGELYAIGSIALAPVGTTGIVERIVTIPQPGLDIKPGSCPNALNVKSSGRLPVALLGTPDFDVERVDRATLALGLAGPIETFTASLDGDQANAGMGTGSTATGNAFMTLNLDTNELTMDLTFTGLLGTQTVQHVHGPAAPDQSAGVMFDIPGPGDFTGFSIVLSDAQKEVIGSGLSYVNVHSSRDPGGEIRGQILPVRLTPELVSIADVGAPFAGELCGCEKGRKDGIPDLVLHFDTDEVVAKLGLAGQGGDAALSVSGALSPDTGTGTLIYRFGLEGGQEDPPNGSAGTGDCTVILNTGTGSISVSCTYEGLDAPANNAHIHGLAQPGESAGVLIPLQQSGGISGAISGGGVLTPALVQGMIDGLTYVNLHTTLNPGGEIRGQIAGGEPFSASDCVFRLHAAASVVQPPAFDRWEAPVSLVE